MSGLYMAVEWPWPRLLTWWNRRISLLHSGRKESVHYSSDCFCTSTRISIVMSHGLVRFHRDFWLVMGSDLVQSALLPSPSSELQSCIWNWYCKVYYSLSFLLKRQYNDDFSLVSYAPGHTRLFIQLLFFPSSAPTPTSVEWCTNGEGGISQFSTKISIG